MVTETNEKKTRRKKWIFIVCFLLIVVGAFMAYVSNARQSPEIIAGDFLPDEKETKKIDKKKVAQEKVDATQFTLSIYPEATFSEKTGKGILHVRNEASNSYPINVKIKRDDTKEIIYETGAINPGREVKEVTLEKPLKQGKYYATAEVDIFDPKTKKKQGTTQAEINILVKE
ncbi:hypothetical protein OCA23_30525 [Bacillus cereus]|nr:hypothetical protein [Bacillus cereus]